MLRFSYHRYMQTIAAFWLLIAITLPVHAQNPPPLTATVCAQGCEFTTIQAALIVELPAVSEYIIEVLDPVHIESDITVGQIAVPITVQGLGAESTSIMGSPVFKQSETSLFFGRVFHILAGAYVTLQGLTIENGIAEYGAGILNEGHLSIVDCIIQNNMTLVVANMEKTAGTGSANNLSGTNNVDADVGGGIYNIGFLDLENSIVQGNQAASGGGIYNVYAYDQNGIIVPDGQNAQKNSDAVNDDEYNLHILYSTIADNYASSEGAGLFNAGYADIRYSTISDNGTNISTPDMGGGIYNTNSEGCLNGFCKTLENGGGALHLYNSTVSNNIANFSGGGIYHDASMLTVVSTTITQNTALGGGTGGLHVEGVPKNGFTNPPELIKTILSGNVASILSSNCLGPLFSHGYNLIGLDGLGCDYIPAGGKTASDIIFMDPMIGPLSDNGGTTLTHLPNIGSPAIDNGTCLDIDGEPVATDQRTLPRPVGSGECDIGSVETDLDISISGTVTLLGTGLPDVLITVTVVNGAEKTSETVLTDANGDYEILVLPGPTYEVTPFLAGFEFAPNSLTFPNLTVDIVAPFAAFPPGGTGGNVNVDVETYDVVGTAGGILTETLSSGETVTIDQVVELSVWRVEPSEYAAFRRFCTAIDTKIREKTRIAQ